MADPDINLIRKKIVPEKDAQWLHCEYSPKLGTRVLIRYWPEIADQLRQKTLDFLNTYGSAENLTANKIVTNPYAGNKEKFSGKWASIKVRMSRGEEPDGSPIQELAQVYDAETLAALAALNYTKTRDNEILSLFDFKEGEGDAFSLVWRNLNPSAATETALMETITDAQLVAEFGVGWTYSARQWKVEDNNTATYVVAFRKIAWNSWTSVRATPDIIEETRVGLNYAARTKTWIGVQKADERAAMDDIQGDAGGVPKDSGYHVVEGRIANSGDGRITVIQTQVAKTTEAGNNLTETEVLAAHSLVEGSMSRITHVYEDYTMAEFTGNSSPGATYTLVDTKTDPSSRSGLYIRRYIYELATWTEWDANDETTYNLITYRNQGRQGEQRTKSWMGIQKADLTTAIDFLKDDANCDDDYHVLEASARDNGNGSITLTQVSIYKVIERAKEDGNLTGQTIVDPHDFVAGTLDTKRSVYESHSAAELALISDNTPTDYTFIRKTPGRDSNGLFSLTFEYEQATWTTWNSSAAADLTIIEKSGLIGASYTKYWFGIRLADASTALSATRSDAGGAAPGAGYHVQNATFRSSGNGSGVVTQSYIAIITQTSATANLTTTELLNAHHLVTGTMTRITAVYDRYTTTELAAITESAPSASYSLVSQPTEMNLGAGLYRREYVYEKTAWPAWSNSAAATLTSYDSQGKIRERRTQSWVGIQKADKATAEAALKNGGWLAAPSGYTVAGVEIRDNGNGSLTCSRVVARIYSWGHNSSAADETGYDNEGTIHESRTQKWYSIDPDDKATALAALKKDGSLSPPSGYTVSGVDVDYDGSGLLTCSRVLSRMFEWDHDSGVADKTDYDNPETDREARTKTWFNIDEDSQSVAVAALTGGTGHFIADTDYIITGVGVRDNQNGTITLRQSQTKLVTAKDIEGTRKLNHQGLFEGLQTTTTTKWENYLETDLPAGTDPAVGNDYLVNEKLGPDGGGFYSRVQVAQTFTWAKTRANAVTIRTKDISDETNGSDGGEILTKFVEGVPLANLVTEFNAISAGSGYVLGAKIMREVGNGMGMLQWDEGKLPTTASIVWYHGGGFYYTSTCSGTGANRVLLGTTLKRRKARYTMSFHASRAAALAIFQTGQPETGSVSRLASNIWVRIYIQQMTGVTYSYT